MSIPLASHRNKEAELLRIDETTFKGEKVLVLVIMDDDPPRGSGQPAPMLLDRSTVDFLIDKLCELSNSHSSLTTVPVPFSVP